MITNDNDVIRAVGYVTIFSSYLEGEIESMLSQLVRVSGTALKKEIWGITAQLKKIKKLLTETVIDHEENIEFIDLCLEKVEHRNRITHGRLIGGMGGKSDRLISGRDGSEKDITPEEVYDLAGQLDDLHRKANIMVRNLKKA